MITSNQHLYSPALTITYMIGAFVGAFAAVYLMQLSGQSDADRMDPVWLRNFRRCAYASISLSMLYGANFVAKEDTSPWLPNVLLVWAITATLIVAIFAIRIRAPAISKMVELGFVKAK